MHDRVANAEQIGIQVAFTDRKAKLASAMNRSEDELHGVMGALGRRINRTAGIEQVHPQGGTSTLLELRSVDGEDRYVMRPALRQVLEELGIVAPRTG